MEKITYPSRFVEFVIQNWFKTPGTLLDIGCGKGEYSDAFEKAGFICTRIDLQGGANIIQIDLNRDKIPKGKFDYIFIRSAIEYCKDPLDILQQCYMALKPTGKIFILTPNWEQMHAEFYGNWRRCSPFMLSSLKMLVEDIGFKINYAEIYTDIKGLWRLSTRAFHRDALGEWLIIIGEK